jgi:hypothetical protein
MLRALRPGELDVHPERHPCREQRTPYGSDHQHVFEDVALDDHKRERAAD